MTQITPDDGIVVVTGAGSGLGRALAVGLCQRGFQVMGFGRTREALEDTAILCGGQFDFAMLDVSDAQAVQARFDQLGPVAVLINNAATYPHRDILEETSGSFMQVMQINLGGVLNCSQAALRNMAERGAGRILNVATFADLAPLPASSAYSVSKGAARILSRAMVADLSDRLPGIVISDWMPGMLQTDMGIPDGLSPEVSAGWGIQLATSRDPSLMGSVFDMNVEILPARGIKDRVKDLLLMRRRKPRVLA